MMIMGILWSSLVYSRKSSYESVSSATLVEQAQGENTLCGSNLFCGRLAEAELCKITKVE